MGDIPSMYMFIKDLLTILETINDKVNKTVCYMRLSYLHKKFKMHEIFNHDKEVSDQ